MVYAAYGSNLNKKQLSLFKHSFLRIKYKHKESSFNTSIRLLIILTKKYLKRERIYLLLIAMFWKKVFWYSLL